VWTTLEQRHILGAQKQTLAGESMADDLAKKVKVMELLLNRHPLLQCTPSYYDDGAFSTSATGIVTLIKALLHLPALHTSKWLQERTRLTLSSSSSQSTAS
jgi:hypothetical protein